MKRIAPLLLLACLAASCATESSRVVETATVASHGRSYSGPQAAASIGRFANASSYLRGIFSNGPDRLGNQAKTILQTHLSQTGRFQVLDRDNLEALAQESSFTGQEQDLAGASIVFTGEVTEFGRKTTGDRQLFGILGRGKRQVAYSKVALQAVDPRTGQVLHAVQGAGEFALSDREVVGFGSTSGYDSTLNGKVLNLSITNAVDKLVADIETGAFRLNL